MKRPPLKLATVTVAVAVAAVVAIIAACNTEDHPECYAGEYRSCSCANGATGYQQCLPTQNGYGACPCDGKTPIADAAIETGIAPGSRQYLEACVADIDCASNVCGIFPTRGNKCSKICTSDAECAAPSPGCTPNGTRICRSP